MRRCLLLLLPALGLAGFSSLKVMPGVRETALGGAGVAIAEGPQSMLWNPAAPSSLGEFAATAGYGKWFLDCSQQALFVVRRLPFVHLGLGAVVFNAGSFEYRDDVPTVEPLGTFNPVDMTFAVNLSRRLGRAIQLGLSVRTYYSKVMQNTAFAPGLDAGVRFTPVERLAIGAAVTEFGRDPTYHREAFRLPLRGRIGLAYALPFGPCYEARVSGEASYFPHEQVLAIHSGLEFTWQRTLTARLGCEWRDGLARPAAGLGLGLGRFRFDYSLTLLNSDLGSAHRASVGIGG